MEKVMSREVDLDELESLAIIGGNDGGTVSPQSIKTTIITIIVTCLSIAQTASVKDVCS